MASAKVDLEQPLLTDAAMSGPQERVHTATMVDLEQPLLTERVRSATLASKDLKEFARAAGESLFHRSSLKNVCGGPVLAAQVKRKDDAENDNKGPGFAVDLLAACFAVFLGATDGLSLGGLLFPHDKDHPNHEYISLGMSMGLLTAFIANFVALLTSQFPHAVGGGVLTVVPIMSAYFHSWGPENCASIMVAVPIMTVISGIMTYIVGWIGVQDVVKVCPFVVFGGFIAGTGVQLLEFSLNMMYPRFTTFVDIGPDGPRAFADLEFWVFCGAGIVMAVLLFFTPRVFPKKDTTFLLIYGVLIMTVSFYVVLFACGISMDEARAQGWLFAVEIPSSPDFAKVWTKQDFGAVKWELLLSTDFALATTQVFIMGTLTTTKNIYGTSEVTHYPIDIDKEVRSAGIQTFCCGLFGGIPGNLVMSYSVTAHKFGVKTRQFAILLMLLSLIFFGVGDYCIAVLPKMVPACVLFWLGILLSVYWVWDAIGQVSRSEHCIVIVMIMVDLFLGPGPMIILGVFLVMCVTIKRMLSIDFISDRSTIKAMRSDVLRTGRDAESMYKCGEKTLILKLAPGYFSFVNAPAILDTIIAKEKESADDPSKMLQLLILNLEGMIGIDATALYVLGELLSSAGRKNFRIVLAGCTPVVEHHIIMFGLPVERLCGCASQADAEANDTSALVNRANQLAKSTEEDFKFLLVGDVCHDGERFLPAYTLALEFGECFTIAARQSLEFGTASTGETPRRTARWPEGVNVTLRNMSLNDVRDLVVSKGSVAANDPALPIAVDIHCWLNQYYHDYDINVMRTLTKAFTVETFEAGANIYAYQPEKWPDWKVTSSGSRGPVPPLVWLLHGEVEHIWEGHKFQLSHFRSYESVFNLKRNQRIEKAVLEESDELLCVGPFQTTIAFHGAMMHAGRLRATAKSKCVLLKRAGYDQLCKESPKALEALTIYLSKKRFVLGSIGRSGFPSLQM